MIFWSTYFTDRFKHLTQKQLKGYRTLQTTYIKPTDIYFSILRFETCNTANNNKNLPIATQYKSCASFKFSFNGNIQVKTLSKYIIYVYIYSCNIKS